MLAHFLAGSPFYSDSMKRRKMFEINDLIELMWDVMVIATHWY